MVNAHTTRQASQDGSKLTLVTLSKHLTTDTLTTCKTSGAAMVVTGPASNFCHGANVLRYWAANGRMVTWLVSLSSADLPATPTAVDGWYDRERGLLEVRAQDSPLSSTAFQVHTPSDYPRPSRQQIAQSVTGETIGNLPMSSRTYDVLTAGLMIPGLSASAAALGAESARVFRTVSGHLVLSAKQLSLNALVEIAANPSKGKPHLERQLQVYESLMGSWGKQRTIQSRTANDLAIAAELLTDYFSVFLLLHQTYTESMARCLQHITTDAVNLEKLAVLCIPKILRWQIEEAGLLRARKDILEPGGEVPFPAFTLREDLEATVRQVLANVDKSHMEYANYLSMISVLKEWKFFLSKALHSHFSTTVRKLLGVGMTEHIPGEEALRATQLNVLLAETRGSRLCG